MGLSRGPHRRRPPPPAERAPPRAREPGELAVRSESPPSLPVSGAGASRPGWTGTSRPSRQPPPTRVCGRSRRRRRWCRPRKSPGPRDMRNIPPRCENRFRSLPPVGTPSPTAALVPAPGTWRGRRGVRPETRPRLRPRPAGSPRWRAEPSWPGPAAGTCRPPRPGAGADTQP